MVKSAVAFPERGDHTPADTRTGSWGLPVWRCHVVESDGERNMLFTQNLSRFSNVLQF